MVRYALKMNNTQLDDYLISFLKNTVELYKRRPQGKQDVFSSKAEYISYKQNEFRCIEEVVLKHGVIFNVIELPKKYKKMPDKECFKNAYTLMKKHEDLTYCEGFAISENGYPPLNHAWCVDAFKNVIDPTWDYQENGMAYFGIPFTREFTIKVYGKIKCSLLDNPKQSFPLMKEFKEEWKRSF